MIMFWVSDLHTWIRMAASRIQQLPGVQKFISNDQIGIPIPKKYRIQQLQGEMKFNFDDKIGIPYSRTYNLTYMIFFLGKCPSYLDQDGCQQDPEAARCTEIFSNDKIGIPITKNI